MTTSKDSVAARIKAWIERKAAQLEQESPDMPAGFANRGESGFIDDGATYQQQDERSEDGWVHLITLQRGGADDKSQH